MPIHFGHPIFWSFYFIFYQLCLIIIEKLSWVEPRYSMGVSMSADCPWPDGLGQYVSKTYSEVYIILGLTSVL